MPWPRKAQASETLCTKEVLQKPQRLQSSSLQRKSGETLM